MFKRRILAIGASLLSALSLFCLSSPATAQFGTIKPMPIGGGYSGTGSILTALCDPLGNLALGGPVAVGAAVTGLYPVLNGAVDASGNAQFLTINPLGGLYVQNSPGTTNGLVIQKMNSAATTNAVSEKASPGNVYNWTLFNTAAYTVFVHFYNKASAPTVGTDVPVFTIGIPAGGSSSHSGTIGYSFSTGIATSTTKGYADTDATATLAGDLVGVLGYK